MKQVEATKDRPYYSVCYQYERNPYTLYSFHRWGEIGHTEPDRTMQGTDNLAVAKQAADKLVTDTGISLAYVFMSEDCYNHKQVYEAKAKS